jgi:hypothetical protein
MDYNTTRNQLVISEYGRNIQKMIEYAVTIEDREKRSKAANSIVHVMAQMHPQVRDTVDYQQKLWDHLHIISQFKLDVDSPYPAPTQQSLEAKPDRVPYQNNAIKFRQYGINLENIIAEALKLEDGEEKNAFIVNIANHIKKSYLNWNRDSVNDELILQHLELLSGGELKMPENGKLAHTGEILSKQKKKTFTKQKKDGRSNHHKGRHRNHSN